MNNSNFIFVRYISVYLQSNAHSLTNRTISVPDKSTCSLIRYISSHFPGINLKEIIPQQAGDAEQQVGVDGFLVVNLVDVRAAIRQFAGKPGGGLALRFHLLFDELADVHDL